ncbi:hypothetical protein CFP65_2116 [Kitasatospora sp. MMS16-BH015]|uniref:M48 family metallopeptidase n=1 Tax=Kitasatospora sp. MMS16-BH015 TaxID=2018025 RepID=UPI000CA159D8|nr:M48 family metallopeptidase [Kitasatospora sp. MMS16-BH015]AUG76971.1 hypothetical protein CFP65_2116 [Kitasatospora sp. MMS16-BH015]
MPDPVLHDARPCPECAEALPDSGHHTSWCPACEWNLSPAAAQPYRPPREQRRQARAERKEQSRRTAVRSRVEKLYGALATDPGARGGGAAFGTLLLATLVHLSTLSLFAGSLTALALGPLPLRVLGLIGAALVTIALRPRLGRLVKDNSLLSRADAPALHGLADRVAAALGTRPVHAIRVTGAFNASYGRVGLRRRSVLSIGLPLWHVLTPQQRVALLAHELGHAVNGDARRGLWLGAALDTLGAWIGLLRPDHSRARRFGRRRAWGPEQGIAHIAELATKLIFGLFAELARLVLALLDRLTTRSGQAAEYRADASAATTASTEAALGMLETLLLDTSARTVITRFRNTPAKAHRAGTHPQQQSADLWTALADQLAAVPPLERERLLRVSARELGAVDVSHPPTYLRMRMLALRPVAAAEATVVLGTAESARVEEELAPARRRFANSVAG